MSAYLTEKGYRSTWRDDNFDIHTNVSIKNIVLIIYSFFFWMMFLAALIHEENAHKILEIQAYFAQLPQLTDNHWLRHILQNPLSA